MNKAKINILVLIVLLILILVIGWIFRPMASSQNSVVPKGNTTQDSLLLKKTKEKTAKTSLLKTARPTISSLSSALRSESKTSTSKSTLLETEEREALYEEIVNAEMVIKSPQNPSSGFEKATVAQLEALEKQYTLKGFELLQDPSDGQFKHVVVFE
ncbi:hypothetical protein [Lactococcus taiwanensis]|uniref:hypothetical protein n=1 Tax=Lactococcus taiwanensis TaxID=1151742 RepID=UPI0035124528